MSSQRFDFRNQIKFLVFFAFSASSKLISRLTSKDDIQKYLQILFDQQIHCLTQVFLVCD